MPGVPSAFRKKGGLQAPLAQNTPSAQAAWSGAHVLPPSRARNQTPGCASGLPAPGGPARHLQPRPRRGSWGSAQGALQLEGAKLPPMDSGEASAVVLSDDKGRGGGKQRAGASWGLYLLLKSGNSCQRCHPTPTAASLTLDVGQREGLGSQGSKKRFVSSSDCGMAQGWGRPTPWRG